jgi:hypothetical protein
MPDGIPLRIVDPFPEQEEPGMMWRYPSNDLPDRECWWIVLPNTKPDKPGYATQISWRTTDQSSKPPPERWQVTGVASKITVSPSIDVECWIWQDGKAVREGSYWHGWIKEGMIV